MGVVYKAYDRELDELVVLKILPEHFANNEEALARFRHEAKAARKLAHPNIVRIHDFGEEGGRKHISMEYVSGGDLKGRLAKQGRFSEDEALAYIRDVARALAHAHGEGVLHRDIKTANILVSSTGRVKLSDFGIAALIESRQREADATGGATAGGAGTPLYMSPEQFEGGELSAASDIYSLGVMFYEFLAGAPPFVKGSIAYHHQFTSPRPIQDIQMTLWRVVERMLAKEPEKRFQTAEELLEALDHFKGRSPTRTISFHDQVTPPFSP
jgi:serine/threonine-protein kinase